MNQKIDNQIITNNFGWFKRRNNRLFLVIGVAIHCSVSQSLAECRQPLGIITKNYLVTRDIHLLKHLAEVQAVHVTSSVTTLDNELAGITEPYTSRPAARLSAIRDLAEAGIPVSIKIAPVIPALTNLEKVRILEDLKNAGA